MTTGQPSLRDERRLLLRGRSAARVAALGSFIAHGVALLVATRWTDVTGVPPRVAPSTAQPMDGGPERSHEPIIVEVVEGLAPVTRARPHEQRGEQPSRGGRASQVVRRPDHRAGTRPADERERDEASGSSKWMTMRGLEGGAGSQAAGELRRDNTSGPDPWITARGPALHIDGAFLEKFLGDTKPLPRIAKSGRLEPSGGGTGVIHDRVTTVTVERGGQVHFADKPDFDFHWNINPLPSPDDLKRMMRQAGRDIAAWYADPYKQARVGRMQDLPHHLTAAPGACESWGDACNLELRQAEADRRGGHASVASGKLGVTEWLMRKFVGDPYASRKLKLLDDTRDERADLGARNTQADLDRSAELMQRNLMELWRTTTDPAARRESLFSMWDECDEGDGPAGEAGQRARSIVIGWIRAKLPRGTPGAFSADDVARLDAHRTSQQVFVPYE